MYFTKMQGLGNDYIYLDCTQRTPDDLPALARRLSDRHFGIGGDGLICICPSDCADFKMRILNADGSEGEMCGNGIRCVGKLVFEKKHSAKTVLRVETLAGVRQLTLHTDGARVTAVTVDMGVPALTPPRSLWVGGVPYTVTPVSMGNPHAVLFCTELETLDLPRLGPGFEHHPAFPDRTNTAFVVVADRTHLQMRVWERGSGETLACGTGACAALAAAASAGYCARTAEVRLPGGALEICWRADGHIDMTGPAVTVFEGEWT